MAISQQQSSYPKYRKFSGKQFKLDSVWQGKKEANWRAKTYRNRGLLARITKLQVGRFTKYLLFTRKGK